MKYYLFIAVIAAFIACKEEVVPAETFPQMFTFENTDQSEEGQFLVTGANTVSAISGTAGTFGAHKDSLKTEVRKFLENSFDLQEIELVNDSTLEFHYIFQGHDVVTPVEYNKVDGQINIEDLFFSGLVSYDKASKKFVLCGVTPFALAGPNASNPTGPNYLNFNFTTCIAGKTPQDYALTYLDQKDLQVQDTIAVLVTKYFYKK